jgi:hypothetical protein
VENGYIQVNAFDIGTRNNLRDCLEIYANDW